MRRITILLLIFLIFSTCRDEKEILAVYKDGEKLNRGTHVPFSLEQNSPNPFYKYTSIYFSVFTDINLTLNIYTEDWYEVQTLFSGHFSANRHVIGFIASDDLPSGDYFYTLEGGGYIQIRKMKIVK